MKAITAITAPVVSRRPSVKRLLIRVIICLTSENLFIFASVISCLVSFAGILLDNDRILASGAIVFLVGFAPWGIRRTCRDIRQDKLGIKEW